MLYNQQQHISKHAVHDVITAGRSRMYRHKKMTHLMARLTSTTTSDSGSRTSRTSRKPSRVPILANKASHLLRPARIPWAVESDASLVKAIVFSLLITSTWRGDAVPTFSISVVQRKKRETRERYVSCVHTTGLPLRRSRISFIIIAGPSRRNSKKNEPV